MWSEWQEYKSMYGWDDRFWPLALEGLRKQKKVKERQYSKLQKARERALTEEESLSLLAEQDRVMEEWTLLREIIKDALNTVALLRCDGVRH